MSETASPRESGPSSGVASRLRSRIRQAVAEHPRMVPGVVDSALSSLATFTVGLFAARSFEPAVLGAYALVFTAFGMATIVPDQLMLNPLEVDAVAHPPNERLRLLPRTLRLGVLPALIPALLLAFWSLFAPHGVHPDVLRALTITGMASALVSPLQDHLRRMLHIAGASWLAATVSIIQLVVAAAIILVFATTDLPPWWAPFGALTVANAVSLVAGVVLALRSDPTAEEPTWVPKVGVVLRSGRWLLLSGLLPNVAAFAAAAIVGRVAGAAMLGYAEVARVVGQPLLVLSAGLSATLGPRITAAAQRHQAAEARRVTGLYASLIAGAGIAYLLMVAGAWPWNPFAWLLPKAYVVSGLVALTVVSHVVHGVAYPGRCELLGAAGESKLAAIETVGGVLRVAIASLARLLGAFGIPLGVLAVGLTRIVGYRRALRRIYATGAPSAAPATTPPAAAAPLAADNGAGAHRIAMFLHSLNDRTVTRLSLSLCRHMVGAGREVVLICTERREDSAFEIPPGVELWELGGGGRPLSFSVPRLAALLRADPPDVLFAHLNGPARAAVLARAIGGADTCLVLVEHTHVSTFGWKHGRLRERMTALLYPYADRVAGVSPGVLEDLVARGLVQRDASALLPAAWPASDDLSRLAAELPDHAWYRGVERPRLVCSVANIVPRKGQDTLVDALPEIRREAGDVRLVLVGRFDDGPFRARLEARAEALGVREHVWFAGYHENALPFIAHADVFALASHTEGCPTVLMEAMGCGVPVVAVDAPGGVSYVLDHGRCGVLVPPRDAPAMARAVVRVLCDRELNDELVRRGRSRAAAFTPSQVSASYLLLADECVRQRDQRRDPRRRAARRRARAQLARSSSDRRENPAGAS